MPEQVKITAILTAAPGNAEELKGLLTWMVRHSRAEPGNLRWDIWQDQSQPDRYVLDELYVDDEAVTAHRKTPHYKEYQTRIEDLADRNVLILKPIKVEH